MTQKVQLEPVWLSQLEEEFSEVYMQDLRRFLVEENSKGKVIYPAGSEYFNALNSTPFDAVKVVILGQDPYHGPNQAHGLCFSVRDGVAPPPSLVNIFKEIQSDLGYSPSDFQHGCLESWAAQGVLLLNSVLTVERHKAASHQGKGWETFTDKIVEKLSAREKPCVFLLWGSYAQKKGAVIDTNRHKVFKAPHPSPLSAHRGFFGCKHFSACNRALESLGDAPIDWRVVSHK
ncbi:MAG: uracil-DNA glycosylase [Pseudomonadales bacterium]|nr:uracil-DNA glycosylase [Pseudomonadales bacterium]MBO7007237.1 uracil-DNA glycosylase [Pseudomonadales bacterium]